MHDAIRQNERRIISIALKCCKIDNRWFKYLNVNRSGMLPRMSPGSSHAKYMNIFRLRRIILQWLRAFSNETLMAPEVLSSDDLTAAAENFRPYGGKLSLPDPAAGEECRKGAPAPVYTPHAICTLTNAKPIIIAAQTLKRCSINRKWLSPNFYFRLELRAIYHSERYEGGALGHAGRWYYSAITWGKMEDLRASKCVHVIAFPLVSRWIIRRCYISKFFNVSSPLCLTLPQWPEILFVTIELRSVPRDLIFY